MPKNSGISCTRLYDFIEIQNSYVPPIRVHKLYDFGPAESKSRVEIIRLAKFFSELNRNAKKNSVISYSEVCNPNIANPKFTPFLHDLSFGLQHAFLYSQHPWLFFGIQRMTLADFFYVFFFLEQPLFSDTRKKRPSYLRL